MFVEAIPCKDEDFLKIIAKEYYGLIGPETKRLDPDTLIFGERYLSNNHPQKVLDKALPYIDVLCQYSPLEIGLTELF